ncbi:MAG: phage integrase N-terminal SAM-like domain-containing protein [Candidatus Eisenbacteria bacterium]|uniref:Phage integrase N-terminal SAM-like domain-containing protein n=1 Tax=Eiseniibacteriota bacterium TaxID=2212470 RepID=A0A956NLK5_UNCEI|nr:phage integrase N-terminal SAM-like domain-containing protein [Candidatus Eisenbacteria bacterium]
MFLHNLHEGDVPDWQIRQAADAVSLYLGQFAPGAGQDPSRSGFALSDTATASPAITDPDGPSPEPDRPPDSESILRELDEILRLRHYSPRTQRCYVGWARRYLRYQRETSKGIPTTKDAKAFLSQLATHERVAASTQNQAFNAILVLHRHVLRTELGEMDSTIRAKRGHGWPAPSANPLERDRTRPRVTAPPASNRAQVQFTRRSRAE